MPAVSMDLLLASSALAGAAAKLSGVLLGSHGVWRARSAHFLEAAVGLGNDVDALGFLHDAELRRRQLDKMAGAAADALALAMRIHNLLPAAHPGAAAAFDGASAAVSLLSLLRPERPIATDRMAMPG